MLLSFPAWAAGAEEFAFTPFDWPAVPITGGRGMDNGTCQVGYYQTDASDFSTAHALLRCGGVLSNIDPPTSVGDRRAFGINDAGVVVGSAQSSTGERGFELSGGVWTWVVYPGANLTTIRGINASGDLVGEYENLDGIRHAFARLSGTFHNVDRPGAAESRARGINDHGAIAGHFDDVSGVRHGFHRTAGGTYTTIDHPLGTATLLSGINNAGEMTGVYFDGAGAPRGFLVRAGVQEPFDVPDAMGTLPTDINERGQVVGEWIDASGTSRGFVATPILFADGFESGDLVGWDGP